MHVPSRRLVVALALGLTVTACAPDASSISPAPAIPSAIASPIPGGTSSLTATGGYFAVSVADLEASERWYEEKLGLEVTLRPPAAAGVSVVVLRGNGLIVELIHQESGPSGSIAPTPGGSATPNGIVKAGVIVDDLDAVVAMLRARDVPILFGPFAATAQQPANLIIEDNEANLIQFIGQ